MFPVCESSPPSAMLTDLYEFTMAQAYFHNQMFAPATFSLFIREYPPHRGYFVSAGLDDVLSFLESAQYSREDLDYLDSTGLFAPDFLQFLASLRFAGDVMAIPEGRLFFQDEPVLEVTAPIIQGQLMETAVINVINFQVNVATKASRCLLAADGRNIVDFSLRRTQGVDAGLKVARAGYIGGLSATSNVLAGQHYGIPVSGTMAHSYVTSFKEEIEAFRAFADEFGDNTVLLIDTYDTSVGAEKAVQVAKEMAAKGRSLRGVRLDSGDMTKLSRQVRNLFRQEGLESVRIFASGGFDEYKIAASLQHGAEIDGFGVGTKMGVSADSPYTDMAYKLVQYDDRPVMKLSSGKKTLVGPKQVFRNFRSGRLERDVIGLRQEKLDGESLLEAVMQDGRRLQDRESLEEKQKRFRDELARLDDSVKQITDPRKYPVETSPALDKLQQRVTQRLVERELGES